MSSLAITWRGTGKVSSLTITWRGTGKVSSLTITRRGTGKVSSLTITRRGTGKVSSLTITREDPNTKRFKRTLIYYDTDTQYANFRGKSPSSSHKTTLKQHNITRERTRKVSRCSHYKKKRTRKVNGRLKMLEIIRRVK